MIQLGDPITLHDEADELDGTGGASVSAWANDDGYWPRDAVLVFSNDGDEDLTIGDDEEGAAMLVVDGIPIGEALFDGRLVTLAPAESIATPAPTAAAALGAAWAIQAPLASAGTIAVSVVARPIEALGDTVTTVAHASLVVTQQGWTPTELTIRRVRGDTYPERFTITDEAGDPVNIAGATFRWTADPERDPATDDRNVLDVEGVIVSAVNGVVEFPLTDEQADIAPGTYWFDVEMVDSGGRVRTVARGRLVIRQDRAK